MKNKNLKIALLAVAAGIVVYLATTNQNRPVTHMVRPYYERHAKPE
jgi:hypothetical protein